METPMVTIPEADLKKLLRAEAKLLYLEAGGVDNWDWYGDSLDEFFERDEAGEWD